MYILLCCWLILTNKPYLLALVTNDSRIILIKINCEIFVKYWVNLKQLMRNSKILWRKSKKINTKKNPDSVYEEQLETKFWRETENLFTLSLSHSCYYDVGGIGATPSSISVKETVVACSTVEWPLILSSSLFLTIHISMSGSPGDVSEEPVT